MVMDQLLAHVHGYFVNLTYTCEFCINGFSSSYLSDRQPGLGYRPCVCLLNRHGDVQALFGRDQVIENHGIFA